MHKLFTIILLLILTFTALAQDFEPGYYVDYNDIEHQGFIRIKKKDGGFRFKESENSKSERISIKEAKYFKMGEREFFVKSFNSGAETWENVTDFLNGDVVVIKSHYFVELIEKGRVNAYVHSDLEFNSVIPDRDREFYLEKGSLVKKVNSDEFINLPLKFLGLLTEFISDDELYMKKYEAKIYRDKDWLTLIRDYNNKYRELPSKKDTVIIYRTKKKQVDEPVTFNIDGKGVWKLYPNTIVKIEVDDITNFQICTDGNNCKTFTGSLIRENYFEASLEAEGQASINYADQESGEYYLPRIEFLMKKARKKSSK